MPFQKGQPRPANAGRKKGSKNKTGADVKNAIVEAFFRAGGAEYLASLKKSHPAVLCSLIGKVVPAELKAEITGKDGGPIITEVTIEHHGIPAAIDAPDVGSNGRQAHPAISSGTDTGMEVNGAIPVDSGGDEIGEDIVVPVVAAPRDQSPWIR